MELRLRNAAFWAGLPRRRGPGPGFDPAGECWPAEADGQPHLWSWVEPNRVCPIAGRPAAGPGPAASSAACRREEEAPSCAPSSPAAQVAVGEEAAAAAAAGSEEGAGRAVRWRGRRQKRRRGGRWPPPPLHYCLLISLALSSGADGSLAVQQIYQFARQHFPFFRTAPDGWKNTVRHNLCFSSRFQKTAEWVCLRGNRKSRRWQLTAEGRGKLCDELQALAPAQLALLRHSTDKPELMKSLFGL